MAMKRVVGFRYFMIPFLLIALVSCSPKKIHKENLIGAWQVDSAMSYYNGFSHMQLEEGHDWGLCTYTRDSMMRESKFETYRSFYFGFKGKDSLFLSPTNTNDTVKLQVLVLNEQILALKMPQKPIFKSTGNQERYEIRYYSRTSPPKVKPKLLPGFKE
ncbi:MAG: hypothetical protein CML04_03795 [Pseudozobellia sp.]|nr:hypothetical protein [Pseudozobellia sp.]MBG49267.1 hypothetical protein [Pseudozobellia sp.]|tara:strand:- start:262 stop:738 length:477 start_codon:yes stop_codon:yes gene_type:complete